MPPSSDLVPITLPFVSIAKLMARIRLETYIIAVF